jgi:hypothetical protein
MSHSCVLLCWRSIPAGVLMWLDRLAAQLTPEVVQQLAAANITRVVAASLSVWSELSQGCPDPGTYPHAAMLMLRPGLLNLARRVALLPADTHAAAGRDSNAQATACDQLSWIMHIYGTVLKLEWRQWPGLETRPGSRGGASGISGQTTSGLWSSDQTAALQMCQVKNPIGAMSSCLCPLGWLSSIDWDSLDGTVLHAARHAVTGVSQTVSRASFVSCVNMCICRASGGAEWPRSPAS